VISGLAAQTAAAVSVATAAQTLRRRAFNGNFSFFMSVDSSLALLV